jgi:hypothetical protein
MSTRVEAAAAEITEVLTALDPHAIVPADAADLWRRLDRVERVVAGAKLRLARKVEESGVWRRQGYPTAAHFLARTAGTTVGQATDQLRASEKLAELTATDDAVRTGELSVQQATLAADAAAVAPDRERELLARAGRDTLREFRDRCARTKAAARGRDGKANHDAMHAARTCSVRPTADGGAQLWAKGTTDAIARMRAVIEAHADQAFRQARDEGRREGSGAYLFDGLAAALATAGDPAARGMGTLVKRPVPAKVLVHVDWDTFARGWPVQGERCEIPGLGPVPVSLVQAMIDSGDAVLAAVVTKGVDVVNVAHLGRKATAFQQTALEWRSPTCVAEGCDRTIVEIDHTEDWARTRITLLKWLEKECDHHHYLKTHHGWKLVAGTGKRPMVPPDDPRHPDRAPPGDGAGHDADGAGGHIAAEG